MWESLLAGAIGGILVSGFGIVLGAFLWINQQRWSLKREIYSELLPMLSRYYVLNRLITSLMLRLANNERVDPLEVTRWQAWNAERDEVLARVDSRYGYFKLFISPESADALTGILKSIHDVVEGMKNVPVAPANDPVRQREEFLTLGKAQGRIVNLTEDALRAVQKSAEEDLRFAFKAPFTDYVIGEGRREPPAKIEPAS